MPPKGRRLCLIKRASCSCAESVSEKKDYNQGADQFVEEPAINHRDLMGSQYSCTDRRENHRLSSTISVSTSCHRSLTGLNLDCPQNLPARFLADCSPRPIPAQEWRVQPPMFTAAIPVDAVIANRS